jgi:hypothetical protein
MNDSKITTLYLTKRALSRLDAVRGPISRSKAVSLMLEGQRIDTLIRNIESLVEEYDRIREEEVSNDRL